MSHQLNPEQQRNIRARFGCDVQSLHDMISFHDSIIRSQDDADRLVRSTIENLISRPLPEVSDYDRLRLILVEALTALDMNAPGVAREALLRGVNYQPGQQKETSKPPF